MIRIVVSTWGGTIALALLVAAVSPVHGDGEAGGVLYLRYCSACHGGDGKGEGIVATVMRPKPTDLTQLAKRAGGEFPFHRTMKAIDGRGTIRAHGDPDMPVWGELFLYWKGTDPDREVVSAGRVALITEYLSMIQEK